MTLICFDAYSSSLPHRCSSSVLLQGTVTFQDMWNSHHSIISQRLTSVVVNTILSLAATGSQNFVGFEWPLNRLLLLEVMFCLRRRICYFELPSFALRRFLLEDTVRHNPENWLTAISLIPWPCSHSLGNFERTPGTVGLRHAISGDCGRTLCLRNRR